VNLIPNSRRERARRTVHLRLWGIVAGVGAGAVLLGLVVANVTRWSDHRDVIDRRNRLISTLDTSVSGLGALETELAEATVKRRASEAVGRRADWSIMLAVLAEARGETIALRRCRLSTGAGSEARSTDRGVLKVDGLGQSQQSVAQFVIRLEQIDLFRTVKLIETRREPIGELHAVAFRIECMFE
jgi:hypothetical protein